MCSLVIVLHFAQVPVLSHRLDFVGHLVDTRRRGDVTDGRARLAGGAVRGAPRPPAGGRLQDARLAERGRRRGPGELAAAQPVGHERGREPPRVADDGRRARVAQRAALAPDAARGAARRPRARPRGEPRRRNPARARGAAGRLGRAGAARGPRDARPRRAAGLRAARHVRRAVRRDRGHGGPLAGRGPAARQPRATPRPGRRSGARRGPRRSAQGRRRVLRRRARRRLRGARRGPRIRTSSRGATAVLAHPR